MKTEMNGPMAAVLLFAATCTGCAFSNHDFDAMPRAGADGRGQELAQALGNVREAGSDRELYDVDMIPLARTHLNVVEEEVGGKRPAGLKETEVHAYLPLFSFVDADVRHYDQEHHLYESSRHRSYLWGLFQTNRERIDTPHGRREQTERTLLWFFRWTSSPEFRED